MSSDWLQVSLRAGFLPSCHWLYFSIHISYFSHLRKHLWYSLSQLQLVPPQLQAGYKPHYSVQDIYQKPYSESDLQQLSNSKLWKCRWIPLFFGLNHVNVPHVSHFSWCFSLPGHPTPIQLAPSEFSELRRCHGSVHRVPAGRVSEVLHLTECFQRTPGWHLALLKNLGEF